MLRLITIANLNRFFLNKCEYDLIMYAFMIFVSIAITVTVYSWINIHHVEQKSVADRLHVYEFGYYY